MEDKSWSIMKCPYCGGDVFGAVVTDKEGKTVRELRCNDCKIISPSFATIEEAVVCWKSIKMEG